MNDNPVKNNNMNDQNNEDGIDLRDLINAIWKRKVMIISMTLVFAIIAGLFSKFIISPVYETKLNIVMSMPETYITKFGDYKLPITQNEQYINLIKSNDVILKTIEDLKYDKKVTVDTIKNQITIADINTNPNNVQNNFHVTVKGGTPEESLKIAEMLYKNYIEFLDVMLKERMISYFYDEFTVKIETARNLIATKEAELKKNQELLLAIPQTINQKEVMEEIQNNVSDYVVLESILNPNYTNLENIIILNKQDINNAQITIEDNSKYISMLDEEKEAISKYYETGDVEYLNEKMFDIVNVNIFLPSDPVAPTIKTSPNSTRNVIVGGFLGGFLGVMIAFFVSYYKKEI